MDDKARNNTTGNTADLLQRIKFPLIQIRLFKILITWYMSSLADNTIGEVSVWPRPIT